jgi:hypothetical protein
LALFALSSLLLPATGRAHNGNPNFRSDIRKLVPAVAGVKVQVLNYDDRLLLTNASGRQVLVEGYEKEPYLRFDPGGLVQVNKRSPSYYLNQDRFGKSDVPPGAGKDAAPLWQTVSQSGRYEWHDHRIHWMSKSLPPEVKDKKAKTKIFNWRVPIEVGGKPASLTGTLYWDPENSTAPVGAFIGLGAFCVLAIGFVLVVRTRRRRPIVHKKGEVW